MDAGGKQEPGTTWDPVLCNPARRHDIGLNNTEQAVTEHTYVD